MIISASRRTDIPAYYSDWFLNRIKAGYVYVRNPMNPRRISEISLSPEVVDGIVFWTKNPAPMLDRLEALQAYTYYFQFTLTPYDTDVERNLPSKNDNIVPTFQSLSAQIGKERVIWRYDPILLNEKYTLQYHKEHFSILCDRLASYTEKCTISFLDLYKNIQRKLTPLGVSSPSPKEAEELAGYFSETAQKQDIFVDTCAEAADLSKYGVRHAHCIDAKRLGRIGKYRLTVEKDKNQRPACGCAASIDIGAYNTCQNGCVYCYANFNQALVNSCCSKHNPSSPLLWGEISPEDILKPREMKACRDNQMNFGGTYD